MGKYVSGEEDLHLGCCIQVPGGCGWFALYMISHVTVYPMERLMASKQEIK